MGTAEGKLFIILEISPVLKVAQLSPASQFQPATTNGAPCIPAHLCGEEEQDECGGGQHFSIVLN